MEPGPDFEKGGREPSVLKAIRDHLSGSWAAVGFCTLAGFLLVIPGLVIPAFSQIFLDSNVAQQHTDWLRPVMLAMVLAVLMQAALKFIQLRYLRRFRI